MIDLVKPVVVEVEVTKDRVYVNTDQGCQLRAYNPGTVIINDKREPPKEGVNCCCEKCQRFFTLVYGDYERQDNTLKISACLSGGIYSVEVICPHCKHTVDLV